MKLSKTQIDLRIALLYLLLGGLWILLSDYLLAALVSDLAVLTAIQTYKGWMFVLVSALVIYLLLHRDIKMSNLAAQRLRESEERYRLIFENSLDAILLTEPGGSIFSANPAACKMFDRTEEEIIRVGRNGIVDVTDPRLPAALEERAQTGVFKGELTFIRQDGSRFPGEISTNIFEDSAGFQRTSMIIRDISERKLAEEALRESEQKFSLLFEKAPFAIALSKMPDGVLVGVNGAFERAFGYTEQEALGKTTLDLGINPDTESRLKILSQLKETGSAHHHELALLTKSGVERFFELNIDLIAIGDQKYILNTSQDITERKQVEEKLRRNDQLFALFVEHSPAAIAMFDHEMKYLVASQRYLVDYGLGGQNLLGRSHYEVFPEIPERWKEIHRRCLAGAVEKAEDDPFPRSDGSLDWVRWEMRPWYETSGENGGVILFSEVVTGRKKMEDALRTVNARLRRFFDANIIGVVIAAVDGGIIETNDYYLNMIGYSRAEFEAGLVNWRALTPSEWLPADENAIRELQERGSSTPYEKEYIRRDGSRVAVFLADALMPDAEGEIAAFALDITDRKRAEQQLRESEERFRSTLDHMMEGCQIIDHDWKYIYLNDAADVHNRRPKEELLGNRYMDMWPGIENTEVFRIIKHTLEDREPHHVENLFEFPDGSTGWFNLSIQPVPEGVFILSIDVSERKQAEIALQQSEEFQRAIIACSPVALYSMDQDGIILSWNISAERIFDWTAGEIVGKPSPIVPQDRWDEFVGVHQQVMQGQSILSLETTRQKRDGQIFIASLSVAPLYNPKGEIIGNMVALEDVTQRKQMEEEIRLLNTELEKRVVERTQQLLDANKELESFSYSVSHDLRAPLRAINGFSSIIDRRHRDCLNEEGRHYLDNILQASERMGLLIDDLLNYSRLGRSGVRCEPVALDDLFARVVSELRERCQASYGEMKIAAGLPVVKGDATLLNQVFMNLLDNALKYQRPNVPPIIDVAWQGAADHVIVQIGDNGIGIPAEYHEKIFNIFQRLHSEDEYPGTGIGLATVKKAVSLLGGEVWLTSQVGQGSAFFVKLPKE
ncbi:MAG: PAS domain S-box protein [Chloroflexota bacterium]